MRFPTFLYAWIFSTVGEHTTPIVLKIVAFSSWALGSLGGGLYLFAQANTPTEVGTAAFNFLATSGPAGALVWFLIWWIKDSRKTDKEREDAARTAEKEKEERFSKILDTVTTRYVEDLREIRKDTNAREDTVLQVVRDNTRINNRLEAKLPLIFPIIDKPSGT